MLLKKPRFYCLFFVFTAFFACGPEKPAVEVFGTQLDTSHAISAQQLSGEIGSRANLNTVIAGKIMDVCKAEGCWIKIEKGNEKPLMVRMKDSSFGIPENAEGKFAFVSGKAFYDTATVAELRHNPALSGADDMKINSITTPETELVFEANGVLVR